MTIFEEGRPIPEIVWELATFSNICWYLYFLAGIGFFGGYAYWSIAGRFLYWCCFPVHALTFIGLKLTLNDHRWILVPVVICIGLAFISNTLNDPTNQDKGGGFFFLIFVFGIITYFAAKPKSYWMEEGKLWDL